MWTKIIVSKVLTHVQAKGREKLQEKYPNINFTTSDKASTRPKFPTVYIRKLQGRVLGRTFEDTKINGITAVFQIDVTTNTDQTDADNVADAIADIMIDMGFDMVGEPVPDSSADVYRSISRWQQPIGHNDKLNF